MKPRLDGSLYFSTKANANAFELALNTLTDRLDVAGEKSEVQRDGNHFTFRLFFDNMTQVQKLRDWAQNNNLKSKLKVAVSDKDISTLTFHQCMHDEGKSCDNKTVSIVI